MKLLLIGPHGSIHIQRRMAFLFETGHQVFLASPLMGKVFFFHEGNWDDRERIVERYFRRHGSGLRCRRVLRYCFRGSLHQLFFGIFYYRSQIRKIISRVRPAVINGHIATSYAFWGSLGGFRPYVLTVWGSDILGYPKKSPIYSSIVRHVLKFSDYILTDGLNIVDEIKSFVPEERIKYIPFGINIKEKKGNDERDGEYINILSARALEPIYQIDKIINLFHGVHDRKCRLIIANDGSKRKDLERLTAGLNLNERVRFTGRLEEKELADLYNRSDVFVALPESDGTSVTLLEAMYYGLIPVLSDIDANRYWIRDGENGFLVDPDNGEQSVAKLNHVIDHLDELRNTVPAKNEKLIRDRGDFRKNMEREVRCMERAAGV